MLISAYRRTEAGEPPEPRSERDEGNDEALHDALVSRLAEAMEVTDPGECVASSCYRPACDNLAEWLPSGSQLCHLNGCLLCHLNCVILTFAHLGSMTRTVALTAAQTNSNLLHLIGCAHAFALQQVALPDALSRRRAARPRTQRHVLSGLQRCTLPSLLLLARNRLPTTRSWPCCGLAPRSCGKRCHFPLHQSTNYWFHVGRVHFVHVHEVFSRAPHR
jgi:hypothetical protein